MWVSWSVSQIIGARFPLAKQNLSSLTASRERKTNSDFRRTGGLPVSHRFNWSAQASRLCYVMPTDQ